MACQTPIYSKVNKCFVPCQKCPGCRDDFRTSWAFRVQQEQKHSGFTTWHRLSYDPEHLPVKRFYYDSDGNVFRFCDNTAFYNVLEYGKVKSIHYSTLKEYHRILDDNEAVLYYPFSDYTMTLEKLDLQRFLDNLQHLCKRELGFGVRYFVAGEYGEKGDRPHYHIFLFWQTNNGLQRYNVNKLVERAWSRGYCTHFHDIQPSAITYTLKYSLKAEVFPKGALEPFSMKSKGIGAKWLDDKEMAFLDNQVKHNKTLFARFDNGNRIPLPRYYREKYKATLTPIDLLDFNVKSKANQKFNAECKFTECLINYYADKVSRLDYGYTIRLPTKDGYVDVNEDLYNEFFDYYNGEENLFNYIAYKLKNRGCKNTDHNEISKCN